MRPVDKGLFQGNKESYSPFGDAKDDLITALGCFCSYCERQGFRSALAVEHIQHKDSFPDLEYEWSNFLLSCTNCNSIKGTKAVTDALLPDRDNTYDVFMYLEGGFIQVKPDLDDDLKDKAQALINLVGLNRIPGRQGYSGKDTLWLNRKESWVLASRYLQKYQNEDCDIETIIDLALNNGFWSVWMQVFIGFPDVQKELINAFSGTQKNFFQQILNL
ncbi:MAG: HNH endonuclease [Methylococcaceae bacterium]